MNKESSQRFKILPHMEGEIVPGENYIYCPTFQMAWDRLRDDLVKAPVRVEGDPEMVRILNSNRFDPTNLPPSSHLVTGGFLMDGIVEETKKQFISRFGENETIMKLLDGLPPAMTPKDFMTFAYLRVLLGFREPFYGYTEPLRFKSGKDIFKAQSFGVAHFTGEDGNNYQRWEQTEILSYRNDHDFILSLTSQEKGNGNQPDSQEPSKIIIAQVPPAKTLKLTWASVTNRIENYRPEFGDSFRGTDIIKMPNVKLNHTNRFEEIIGKKILNPGFHDMGIRFIEAVQFVNFHMNKEGVKLESAALLGGGGAAAPKYVPPPRRLIVDQPFLVALTRDKEPYLVLWIDNPGFLERSEMAEEEDVYERGSADAEGAIKRGVMEWKVVHTNRPSYYPGTDCDRVRQKIRLALFGMRTEGVDNMTDEPLDTYVQGYNDRMIAFMNHKYGPTFLEQLETLTDRQCSWPDSRKALPWLITQQNKDGSWGSTRNARPILTSLCLLSTAAQGETTRSERYGPSIESGIRWLAERRSVSKVPELPADTLGTIALLEFYQLEAKSKWLSRIANEQAERLLTNFRIGDVWQLLALKSCKDAGLSKDKVTTQIMNVVERTAEGLQKSIGTKDTDDFIYWTLAQELFSTRPIDAQSLEFLRDLIPPGTESPSAWPLKGRLNLALACILSADKEAWNSWGKGRITILSKSITPDGFWDYPDSAHCAERRSFGDLDAKQYTTAMSRLTLSLYYRYLSFTKASEKVSEGNSLKIELKEKE